MRQPVSVSKPVCRRAGQNWSVGAAQLARLVAAWIATVVFACPLLLHAAPIVVGQVAPLSGLEASQGRAYSAGLQLLFGKVNKAGGVNGHTFSLVRKDDGGDPHATLSETKRLLEESRPLVLAGYFGNRNVSGLVASGVLEKEKIALLGYRVTEIRPETPLLYSVRATLREEIGKIVEHLATVGITKLGLFYENGPNAPELLAVAESVANRAGASISLKVSHAEGAAKMSSAVETFVSQAPQAIIMVINGSAAASFIEQYRSRGGKAQLFAHSGADIEQLSKRLADEQMQGIAITQVTPSPYKLSNKLTKDFLDAVAMEKYELPLSYAMLEGYIAAQVIVEAVRRQGARPSREGMVSALDGMDSYNLGGYVIGFKPSARTGSKFVELSIISAAGKIRQ